MRSPLIRFTLQLIVVATITAAAHAQSLYDDFNGSAVNTSLWNVILPFSQSYITEGGGYLTTGGRGTLVTAKGFPSPVIVSGSVILNQANEHFSVTLRTDLSTNTAPGLSQYYVLTGIMVAFNLDDGKASIQQINATDPNPVYLAITPYAFSVGTPYSFVVTDEGTSIDVAIDGQSILSGSSTFSTGDLIAFQSREFSYTSSSLNYVSIKAVPEITYTWSTTTTGFAWLNASHWTGNPGDYPGVDANSKSIADGANNDVAAFSSMAFAATILGINFSPSYNNGVTNNTGANGSLTLGAIDYLSSTNKSISIGDNSGSPGTLTLRGATLNGVVNTILANEGSNSLTLAPQIGGGTQDMTLALGNAASNVIQVNGSGGITISAAIQNGAGVAGSLTKTGRGTLTLSHANTYTGRTIISKGTVVVENTTGSATGSGQVKVNLGTLAGVGTINGAVTVGTGSSAGAILLAGNNATSPATLTINNTLTFNSLSTYKCVLNRNMVKASNVSALGMTINNSVPFTFVDTGSGTLATGTVFTVINNTSANPIFGTFSNLPNGSTFTSNGNNFQVSYTGGTGNDLTLKVVP